MLGLSEANTTPLTTADADRATVLHAVDAEKDPERVNAMAHGLWAASA